MEFLDVPIHSVDVKGVNIKVGNSRESFCDRQTLFHVLPLLQFYSKSLTLEDEHGFEYPIDMSNEKTGELRFKLPFYGSWDEAIEA